MPKIEGTGAEAIAISALRAQEARMKVIAENVANSDSTGATPGADPYRRQVPEFKVAETEDGARGVAMSGVQLDPTAFSKIYQPGAPAADASGYVKQSNVNGTVEALDMKDAQRAYGAALNVLETLDAMEKSTIKIIKKV